MHIGIRMITIRIKISYPSSQLINSPLSVNVVLFYPKIPYIIPFHSTAQVQDPHNFKPEITLHKVHTTIINTLFAFACVHRYINFPLSWGHTPLKSHSITISMASHSAYAVLPLVTCKNRWTKRFWKTIIYYCYRQNILCSDAVVSSHLVKDKAAVILRNTNKLLKVHHIPSQPYWGQRKIKSNLNQSY